MHSQQHIKISHFFYTAENYVLYC